MRTPLKYLRSQLSYISNRWRRHRLQRALGPWFWSHPSVVPSTSSYAGACVIFSMDRAMQLHALLSTYLEKMNRPVPAHVLYRATTAAHAASYKEMFHLFPNSMIRPVQQPDRASFKPALLQILEGLEAPKVFFLVDDILFVEQVNSEDFLSINPRTHIASLRLGSHLTRCYTEDCPQPHPTLEPMESEGEVKLRWRWSEGRYDWGYPLSVDGHLFDTEEMRRLSSYLSYSSPNTFESALQLALPFFRNRWGLCYPKSKIVNVPCNKVHHDNQNRHGELHQDQLLALWNEGKQINYRSIYGVMNQSAHQELSLSFVHRVLSVNRPSL